MCKPALRVCWLLLLRVAQTVRISGTALSVLHSTSSCDHNISAMPALSRSFVKLLESLKKMNDSAYFFTMITKNIIELQSNGAVFTLWWGEHERQTGTVVLSIPTRQIHYYRKGRKHILYVINAGLSTSPHSKQISFFLLELLAIRAFLSSCRTNAICCC